MSTLRPATGLIIAGMIVLIPLLFTTITYDTVTIKLAVLQIGSALALSFFLIRLINTRPLFYALPALLKQSWPVLLYFVWQIISAARSQYHHAAVEELARSACFLALYLAVRDIAAAPGMVRRLAILSMAVCTAAILYGLLQVGHCDPFIPARLIYSRIVSTFGNANYFAAYLAASAPLLLALSIQSKPPWRYLYAALGVLLGISLYYTGSRGGIVGLTTGMAVFGLITVWRRAEKTRTRIMVAAMGFGAIAIVATLIFVLSLYRTNNVDFRLQVWKSTVRIIASSPLAGHGLGSFRIIFPPYMPQSLKKTDPNQQMEIVHPENEYLEIAAESGLIGLGLFALMIGTTIATALRRIRYHSLSDKERMLIIAFSAGIAALLAQNVFCVNLRSVASGFVFWLYLGIISGPFSWPPPAAKTPNRSNPLYAICIGAGIGLTITVFCFAIRLFLADVYLNNAVKYSQKQQWSAAIDAYRLSIRYNPAMLLPRYFLGNAYLQRARYTDLVSAAAQYDTVLARAPHYTRIHVQYGTLYSKLGQWSAAAAEFKKSIQSNPGNARVHFGLAVALNRMGQLDSAQTHFMLATHYDSTMTDALVNSANIFQLQKNYVQAQQYYIRALQINPANGGAYRNYTVLLAQQGKTAEARAVLKTWKTVDPDNGRIDTMMWQLDQVQAK